MNLNEYQQEVLRTARRSTDTYPACIRLVVDAALEVASKREAPGTENEITTAVIEMLNQFDQLVWCLGLAGEVGEALDMIKKSFGHGHKLDLEKLKKEFGDVRWYGAALEWSFGFTSDSVAEANVAKLKARFPNGFSAEASKARADEPKGEQDPVCPRCYGDGLASCQCETGVR